jgi:hypothetical protein
MALDAEDGLCGSCTKRAKIQKVEVTQEMFDFAVFTRNMDQLTTWATNGEAVRFASGWHLRYVIEWCPPKMLQFLVQAFGADVDCVDKEDYGHTVLILAAKKGIEASVRCLIDLGANVAAVSTLGDTALIASISMYHFRTARYLIEEAGANTNDCDMHNISLWELLLVYMAKVTRGDIVELDPSALTALLRVMVLHSVPHVLMHKLIMLPERKYILEMGAKVRAALPAYLAQRRALLYNYTLLIAPLQIIVDDYMELTTTDELWDTLS